MGKAIAAILVLVLLVGGGFLVYHLTSAPEDVQEWWDEKRLENFPAIAGREIKDMEDRLGKLRDQRRKLDVERIKLAGDEKFGKENFSTADTDFMTLFGYDARIKSYTAAGEALGKAYANAKSKPDAVVNADGKLADDYAFACSFTHPETGRNIENESLTVKEVMGILGEIEERLTTYEYERALVQESIKDYESTISQVDATISAQEAALKEFRQEVKKIEAQLKMLKVKEDLQEINKAIKGEQSNSELGKLISQYEKKKKDFTAKQIQEEGSAKTSKSLADLGKGGSSPAAKSSRFVK